MTALSELIIRVNREKLTHRQVTDAAKKAGVTVSYDSVWKAMSGRHGKVGDPTLRAIAAVLPVRFEDLRSAADLPTADLGPYEVPAEVERLGQRERNAITEIIRLLAAPREAGERDGATTNPPDELKTRRGQAGAPAVKAAHPPRPGNTRRRTNKPKESEGEEGKGP